MLADVTCYYVVFHSIRSFTQIKANLAFYVSEYAKLKCLSVSDVLDELIDPKKEPDLNLAVRTEFAVLFGNRRAEVLPPEVVQTNLFRAPEVVGAPKAHPVINNFDGVRKRIQERCDAHKKLGQDSLARSLDLEFYFSRRERRLK